MGSKDIIISEDFINQREFSFAKIKIGRSSPVILSLESINEDLYEWVSADQERIYTFNGKIVRTEGLIYNTNHLNISIPPDYNDLPLTQFNLIMLSNPDAMIKQQSELYLHSSSKTSITVFEEIETSQYEWNFTNEYVVDKKSMLVTKSVQKIHPKLSTFNIEFFYKF
tara:strand:- start:37 stop:540 length:504 start_codon:yes stop_codon:yes gene_type:complete